MNYSVKLNLSDKQLEILKNIQELQNNLGEDLSVEQLLQDIVNDESLINKGIANYSERLYKLERNAGKETTYFRVRLTPAERMRLNNKAENIGYGVWLEKEFEKLLTSGIVVKPWRDNGIERKSAGSSYTISIEFLNTFDDYCKKHALKRSDVVVYLINNF